MEDQKHTPQPWHKCEAQNDFGHHITILNNEDLEHSIWFYGPDREANAQLFMEIEEMRNEIIDQHNQSKFFAAEIERLKAELAQYKSPAIQTSNCCNGSIILYKGQTICAECNELWYPGYPPAE